MYILFLKLQKMTSLSKHKRGVSRFDFGPHNKPDDALITQKVRCINGEEITRRYLKTGLLGRGGFASCYITENIETKRQAATKIVTKEELRSHRTKLRLANQIRLHKTLHHPNVVELYHCYEDKDHVYIFLELCQNQSLSELINVRGSFITPQVQSFILGLASGLKYIHSQGIMHRDLKLKNIFIDGNLRIKIGDFGLATKLQFKRECKRTVCGTPNYISPETLQGKGYHLQVDIWSVGVILYTLFYGIPPFETEDANSTYQKIRKCQYFIPKSMHVPAEANNLIRKILVRNPAERPTLQDIINSDFLRIGQGILKELPMVCSRRAPTKKDITAALANAGVSDTSKSPSSPIDITRAQSLVQIPTERHYMVEFEEVLPETYRFKMASGLVGIVEGGVQVCYKTGSGDCILHSLTTNQSQLADKKCKLMTLLMSFQRRFNIMDDQFGTQNEPEEISFPRRVERVSHGWVVRLSSGQTQCLFGDSNYVLREGKVSQVVGEGEKEVSIEKQLRAEKGNRQHLTFIRKLINDYSVVKHCSGKENYA